MKSSAPVLLPLLRSRTQGDIYARLFLEPRTRRSITELAAEVGASVSQTMREVNRLEDAGLVETRRSGQSRIIWVLDDNVVYQPLAALMAVTYGPVPVLAELIAPVSGIEDAFIYGSWAARYLDQPGPVPGDIDVLVIGSADRDELYDIGTEAGRRLVREVHIRRVTRDAWNDQADSGFRRTVEGRPVVALFQAKTTADE